MDGPAPPSRWRALSDWPSLVGHRDLADRLFGPAGRDRVQDWFDRQCDRVDDPEFARLFTDHISLPGIAPADYAHRVVRAEGCRVLGGIRFFNGRVDRPFVELVAWAAEDGSEAGWTRLRRMVLRDWAAFRPRSLRVLVPADTALPDDAVTDMTVHAATYRAMAAGPAAETAVHLTPFEDVRVAVRTMRQRYADVAATDAALAANVGATAQDDLAALHHAGRLLAILNDGRVVGLIATEAGAVAWVAGDVVVEQVIGTAHAGRGLAAAAQQTLARAMSAHPLSARADTLLLGTIDRHNIASRKAALRAGRPAILRYAFIPLTAGST